LKTQWAPPKHSSLIPPRALRAPALLVAGAVTPSALANVDLVERALGASSGTLSFLLQAEAKLTEKLGCVEIHPLGNDAPIAHLEHPTTFHPKVPTTRLELATRGRQRAALGAFVEQLEVHHVTLGCPVRRRAARLGRELPEALSKGAYGSCALDRPQRRPARGVFVVRCVDQSTIVAIPRG
jgi:hypothetical protein